MKVKESVIRAALDRGWKRAGFQVVNWPDGSSGIIGANSRHCKIGSYIAEELLDALGVEIEEDNISPVKEAK